MTFPPKLTQTYLLNCSLICFPLSHFCWYALHSIKCNLIYWCSQHCNLRYKYFIFQQCANWAPNCPSMEKAECSMNPHSVAFLQQTSTDSILLNFLFSFLLLLLQCVYVTLTLNFSLPFLQREDGEEDKNGEERWKGYLLPSTSWLSFTKFLKYLSSIDEELVMPVLQDLDQDPKLPWNFENLGIWGFGATTDGGEDQPLGLHLDPDRLSPTWG